LQIENAFAEELTRAGSQERTQDEMRDELRASDTPVAAVPPEIAERVMRQHLSQHYSTRPDHLIPVLSGKSPRDAMKTEAVRRERVQLQRRTSLASDVGRLQDAGDLLLRASQDAFAR